MIVWINFYEIRYTSLSNHIKSMEYGIIRPAISGRGFNRGRGKLTNHKGVKLMEINVTTCFPGPSKYGYTYI